MSADFLLVPKDHSRLGHKCMEVADANAGMWLELRIYHCVFRHTNSFGTLGALQAIAAETVPVGFITG